MMGKLPGGGIELRDREGLGQSSGKLPGGYNLSKNHISIANQNHYHFIKDSSKQGTYVKIPSGKRLELFKGSQFSVGRVWFKVANIEGNAPCNAAAALAEQETLQKQVAERRKSETAETSSKKKVEVLDSDEEYADSDDEGGRPGNYEGPATLIIASVDKKLGCKEKISETTTIGRGGSNGVDIPKDPKGREKRTKMQAVQDGAHTKIIVEDGRFFIQDAGSSFGTYYGIGKRSYFQIADGDMIMMAGCRCKVSIRPFEIQPQQGLVDKIIGAPAKQKYDAKIIGTTDIEERLKGCGCYTHQ